MVRVPVLGTGGCKFESCHLDKHGLLVQLARTSDLHSEGRGFESHIVHKGSTRESLVRKEDPCCTARKDEQHALLAQLVQSICLTSKRS